MIWQYSPLPPLLLISAALTAVLSVIAWKNRQSPGGKALTIFLSAATLWSAAYALELSAADLESNLLFTDIEYFGIAVVPPAFLAFALSYTGREHLLTRSRVLLLALFPALTIIAVLSNDLHHLYYTGFTSSIDGGAVIWLFHYGPLFWIYWIIAALLILAALVLLITHLLDAPAAYRSQIGLLLIACIVPLIADVLYVLKTGPVPGLDLTPVGFLVTGLTLEAATIRYQFFSVTPVARSLLPGVMTDSMIVLDDSGRIVDVNSSAAVIAGLPEEAAIGMPFDRVFPSLKSVVAGCTEEAGRSEAEVEMTVIGQARVFISRCQRMKETSRNMAGYLVVLHDVTDLLHEKAALKKVNEKLGLLADITRHDILNQLTAVTGYMDLAIESEDIAEIRGDLGKSRAAAENVRHQLEFARDYSSLGRGSPQWFDLVAAAQSALVYAGQNGMRTGISCTGVTIYADPLIERTLFNLAHNAVAYSATATEFRISCTIASDGLVIVVEDNGIGVPDEEKEIIFRRGVGKHTGLGLFMVREILGITGMTIREIGTPGQGARFEISVPPGCFRTDHAGIDAVTV
ncbi:histidine kinase N-terminal 7TM domain-containing protein [Methanofollis ethanolicus]|uniref:histidine kinase N-terminal 7TM domain-containing protein n=1 Tax=Methanofollis ethanolicus TaxID=488124 RepID=UPI000835649A|nr:histidine kinase N-terminal 7TM domain-containing protein [Methanofollis ethanolicus]